MQDSDVEREAELVPCVGDAGAAEVQPRGCRGTGTEDQQKAAEGLHIGNQINQRNHTYQAADDGPADSEYSFLVAGTDGR